MTIALTGTGGMFTRLGTMGKSYLSIITNIGSALSTNIEAIRAQYQSGNEGGVTDNIYATRDSYRTVHSGYLNALQSMMQANVISQTDDDTPLFSKTLSNALAELIRQMKASSDSILRGTSTATVTAYSGNKGDAKIVTSFLNGAGDAIATAYPESVKFTCTTDTTNYQEVFTITGAPTKAVTAYDWPGGSGASGSLTLFNAVNDSVIKNGGFTSWANASSAPDNWTYSVGVGGTTLIRDTTVKRTGVGYAIQFLGDGSTLHSVKQQLQSSQISANQVLAFGAWAKASAADTDAVLGVRLVDGTGAVIANDAGTNNSATFDMNGTIGTSYTFISTFFQLPRQLPSTGVFLQLYISSGTIDSAKSLNLSLVGLTPASLSYAGGPYWAGFSAASAHAAGDYFTNAIANSVSTTSWVRAGQRWLGMPSLGLYFPTVSVSPTVADSLLT